MRVLTCGAAGMAALLMMALPAGAQEAAPAQAAQQGGGQQGAAAKAKTPTHHAVRRHRRARHAKMQAEQAGSIAPQGTAETARGDTDPAPVPNEDLTPPQHTPPSEGEVSGGSMSIHYPPVGEGFLPGSSSSDMDNRTTPSVPGVQYQEPIANPAPAPLPPPQDVTLPKG